MVSTDELALTFDVGGRPALGWLLLAAAPDGWPGHAGGPPLSDPIARVAMDGVRTRGTAGGGRREWYSAQDMHRIKSVSARFDGVDLGDLRPVDPAGAGSASPPPRRPRPWSGC